MAKQSSPVKPGERTLILMFIVAIIIFVVISIGFGVMEHNGSIR
jgi:hypothetical protein